MLNRMLNSRRTEKGFKRTSSFMNQLTQQGFERKGFAQAKLITNWNDIIGLDFCKFTKPVKITFPKNEVGAILTIEINGAFGPELDMQKEIIREKVNRIYGYNAVTKIRFRVSSHLGYTTLEKDSAFVDQSGKSCEVKTLVPSDQADYFQTTLDNVKNKELRKSLFNLSNSFVNRMK